MRRSAACDPTPTGRRRALAVGGAVVLGLLVQPGVAAAQVCRTPALSDNVCQDKTSGTIDDYKECYADLYDLNVIPAFQAMAECSHVKADKGLREVLEQTAAMITGAVKQSLDAIDATLNAPTGSPSTCIADLNAVADALKPYLDAERAAPDLDAYRRAHYSPAHFKFFQDLVLAGRQNRAACDGTLQAIKKSLVLLADLKARHPDYCAILRQSANYASVSHIEGLAEWTAVDPAIHFDQYFNFMITLNSECGYYEFDRNGQSSVHHTTCATLTTEYKQTLAELDGALGWVADHRALVVTTSTAVAVTIFSLAGYGSAAGPYGALVGAAVGLIIAGLEYLALQDAIDELEDLIEAKQLALRDVVAANLITEAQFNDKITERCTAWQPTVDARVQQMLQSFDAPRHLAAIGSYYTVSDGVNDWYNELFLWASTPGPDGRTFLDLLAKQDLLAQKDAFDQRIFSARADQEVATQRNALSNIKSAVTQLGCASLTPPRRNIVKAQMNAAIRAFNRTCAQTMDTVAVRPDAPVPFTDATATSDVVCAYKGFRNDVASLEIGDGDGFASNLTLKDAAGAVIGSVANATSDTDFTQAGVPGFACASETLTAFGTTAAARLKAGTYALRMQDNILGFDAADAAALRPAVQTLDSQLRLKEISCTRQLGSPITIPRPADACGIPLAP